MGTAEIIAASGGGTFSSAFGSEMPFQTRVLSPKVKSLQVHLAEDWRKAPVIDLDGEQQVCISFDEMSHEYLRLAYRVVHCNADWRRSDMNELEYMEGFSENDLPEGQTSEATTVEYTHYELLLPNENLQLKLSGNYMIEIYDRDAEDEESVLLHACFSVLDRKVGVDALVSQQTDFAYNTGHHQLSIEVQTSMGFVKRPDTDVKILIRQNRRVDNQVLGVPLYMSDGTSLFYQHQPSLIFEAGNEYRRFEISSHKLPGMGVDRLDFQRPYYHAILFEAQPRTSGYTYDEDQNGRFYIRNREADFLQTDYQVVHFSLSVSKPLAQPVYLLGDLVQANGVEASLLEYNPETSAYETQLLLKQGLYNYLYVVYDDAASAQTSAAAGAAAEPFAPAANLTPFEGNYWPTENEYQIFVYYRPLSGQYDALIGYREVRFPGNGL